MRWIDFEPPPNATITIAHQRNVGVRASTGDVVVFTDSGCVPEDHWLELLLAPIIEQGETVTCGPARAGTPSIYSGARWWGNTSARYVNEAATINLAFRRELFDAVGGFDESFGAGEDLDFTWRLRQAGHRLRWVPDAVVRPEWGSMQRQLRRSVSYGRGWARLLRKHRGQSPLPWRRTRCPSSTLCSSWACRWRGGGGPTLPCCSCRCGGRATRTGHGSLSSTIWLSGPVCSWKSFLPGGDFGPVGAGGAPR